MPARLRPLLLLAAWLVAVVSPALAERGYSNDRGGSNAARSGAASIVELAHVAPGTAFNAGTTKTILSALRQGTAFCQQLAQREYVLDCLAYQYWEVQRRLPGTGDYADVRAALRGAAGELETLAKRNKSSSAPSARLSTAGGRATTTRAIVPVATGRLSAAGDRGADLVAQAQSQLLRSPSRSRPGGESLVQIAQALDSGAALLRSL
ncbi:hypothetical protein [Tropicimonas sp. IMCC6043]|uniref:hypothetical protein n=1 Tax=Tropicimonas sp. IMCC6043 TaxID=2510645 RepID=UPI00101CA434|nr:hypothetical protein [Tropicimonas sp. IMCC6043]RYH11104.1 hypothetical protein EU800_04375 [Tropicimonas sp. IMCC6043]